jgi:hypothetical protein
MKITQTSHKGRDPLVRARAGTKRSVGRPSFRFGRHGPDLLLETARLESPQCASAGTEPSFNGTPGQRILWVKSFIITHPKLE